MITGMLFGVLKMNYLSSADGGETNTGSDGGAS